MSPVFSLKITRKRLQSTHCNVTQNDQFLFKIIAHFLSKSVISLSPENKQIMIIFQLTDCDQELTPAP